MPEPILRMWFFFALTSPAPTESSTWPDGKRRTRHSLILLGSHTNPLARPSPSEAFRIPYGRSQLMALRSCHRISQISIGETYEKLPDIRSGSYLLDCGQRAFSASQYGGLRRH